MIRLKKILAVLILLWISVASIFWWLDRPKRITQEFAGHLFHERYAEADSSLEGVSSLILLPQGDLLITDQAGNSVAVQKSKLPFKIGGGKSAHAKSALLSSDFIMTALGGSVGGVLSTPPVVLYLGIEKGKVRIESVDS